MSIISMFQSTGRDVSWSGIMGSQSALKSFALTYVSNWTCWIVGTAISQPTQSHAAVIEGRVVIALG